MARDKTAQATEPPVAAQETNAAADKPKKAKRTPDREFKDLARIDAILTGHTLEAALRITGMIQSRLIEQDRKRMAEAGITLNAPGATS